MSLLRSKAFFRYLAVAGIILAALVARVVTSSARELAAGEALRASGDLPAAVVHLRRAARFYAPGSPYHVAALTQLADIAADAERQGEVELALSAYRAVRGAILSARSFYIPERERLAAANGRIADLMAALPPPPMDADKSREQLRKEHLALLEQNRDPHLLWTLVLLLGFVAWVGGAFVFSVRAIDEEDRWVAPQAYRWGAVILVGLLLFVLGLSQA